MTRTFPMTTLLSASDSTRFQGCQIGFLKPDFEILAFLTHLTFLKIKSWLFLTFFQSEVLALAKHCLSCISITYVFWRESVTMQGAKNIAKIFLLPWKCSI